MARRSTGRLPVTVVVAIVYATLAGAATPAHAGEPPAHVLVLAGGRANVGQMGDHYALGWVWGFQAGYQPTLLGGSWAVLFGKFYSSNDANIEPELTSVEMNFSLRGRFVLTGRDTALLLTSRLGLDVVRLSAPVPPDNEDNYIGPAAGAALELVLGGEYLFSLGARYSMVGGPTGVTVLLSFGAGGLGR